MALSRYDLITICSFVAGATTLTNAFVDSRLEIEAQRTMDMENLLSAFYFHIVTLNTHTHSSA